MNQIKEMEDLFYPKSPKVKAMYDAVLDMVNERYSFSQIKVSDITSRAGIGKGTAYEYFSSKEEIVVKAVLYNIYYNMHRMEGVLSGEGSFEEKFYRILDFMEDNMEPLRYTTELLRGKCETIHKKLPMDEERFKIVQAQVKAYVNGVADRYMETGMQENCFTQSNVILRRNTLYTAILGYFVYLTNDYYDGDISREEARRFTYQGMIATLSQ